MRILKPLILISLVLTQTAIAARAPVAQLPVEKAHVLDIKHWDTKNGTRVYFVSAPEIPMVDVNVVFDAGSARDEKNYGLANFTNHMLSQGADEFNADDIAVGFENIGVEFETSLGRDQAILHMRSLTGKNYLPVALRLFNLVLTRPTFPAQAFEREQKAILQALQHQQQSPERLANNAMYTGLYDGKPYGHPVLGTSASISKINRYQLQKFYRRYYVAKNAIVTIVGAVDEKQAHSIAEHVTSGLRSGDVAGKLSSVRKHKKQRIMHVFYPSKQTHIRIGEIGVKRNDPDYLALYVGNNILGGDPMTSRLFMNVREKQGLSYSIYSYFKPLASNGPFVVGLQTKLDQTAKAITVVSDTLRRFIEEGPTEQELAFTKKNLVNGLPLRLASNASISRELIKTGFYKMRLDHLDDWAERVNALTTTTIKDAFQKQLDLNRILIVTVGAEASESKHLLNKINEKDIKAAG